MSNPLIHLDALAPEPPAGTWVLNVETGHALHRANSESARWYHYPEQRLMTWENAWKNYGPLTPVQATKPTEPVEETTTPYFVSYAYQKVGTIGFRLQNATITCTGPLNRKYMSDVIDEIEEETEAVPGTVAILSITPLEGEAQ